MINPLSLEGKNILITGASSGLGRAVSSIVGENSGNAFLAGRDVSRLNETLELIPRGNHHIIPSDLTSADGIDAIIEAIPNLDGVVFSAGIVEYNPIKFLSEQKISEVFKINFDSQVLLCQKLIKKKRLNKQASLVFISSISAHLGISGTAMYAASKAALISFSKVLASELANQKIRSNSISPGIFVTPMTSKALEVTSEEDLIKMKAQYPLGFGTPEDVAELSLFLLSDKSKWITGSDIVIDGGFSLS